MLSIQERYAQAIRSANLTCDVNTTFSDLDVIGAMAFADRRLSTPDEYNRVRVGAGAVSRLLAGDYGASAQVIRVLSERITDRAQQDGETLSEMHARDICKACIAWLLHGACRECGGQGVRAGLLCQACEGTGKLSFITHFRHEHKGLAKWLVQDMARDLGLCGAGALRAIAPRKDGETE